MNSARFRAQLAFIVEVDRLKGVLRRSTIMDGSRRENTAEHSWHVALMAFTLAEHANEPVDPLRVVTMLLVHDVVEIDAGDTYAYDEHSRATQQRREEEAARRIFGLLPEDQAAEYTALWREFDAATTPDARMANAVDRLMPLLHNYYDGGKTWQTNGVTRAQVDARMAILADGSDALWQEAQRIIDRSVAEGLLTVE